MHAHMCINASQKSTITAFLYCHYHPHAQPVKLVFWDRPHSVVAVAAHSNGILLYKSIWQQDIFMSRGLPLGLESQARIRIC